MPKKANWTGRYICGDHFRNEFIARFAQQHAVSERCDFCTLRSGGLMGAPFKDVLAFIREGLESIWTTDIDDSVDDGSPVYSYSTRALLQGGASFPDEVSPIKDESVVEEIANALEDLTWYDRPLTYSEP